MDPSAYADLIDMCGQLQRLKMTNMGPVAEPTRNSLALLAAGMIARAGPHLIELDFG